MHWLTITRIPVALACPYCGQSGRFPHAMSYAYEGDTFSLHAYVGCGSLIYDLSGIDAQIVPLIDLPDGDMSREARYSIETGFSSNAVAACVLAVLPNIPDQALKEHVFVDVGAGLGMASYLARTLFGLETVTIEPSFTGKIARDVLGLDVQRAYFEDLPAAVLGRLANKPCLLHLNSVVEHLVDPASVLADMIARARVEVIAAIVPDAAGIDPEASFLSVLPFLAPRDHRHLPTRIGLEHLLKRLGFAHVSVAAGAGLLTGTGSRHPIPARSERTTALTERAFLEDLKRHPNALVSGGGASRLLPMAVLTRNALLADELVPHFPYEASVPELLAAVRRGVWDDLPYHLGTTCYWLGWLAYQAGRLDGALGLLAITQAFGEAMARDYPQFAMTAIDFKWAAALLEAHVRAGQGDLAGAMALLQAVLSSRSDATQGARAEQLRQAERDLEAFGKALEQRFTRQIRHG